MPTLEGGLDFKKNLTEAMDGYSGSEHTLPIAPLFKAESVNNLVSASKDGKLRVVYAGWARCWSCGGARRGSRRGFCPPAGQNVTCNAPPSDPPETPL